MLGMVNTYTQEDTGLVFGYWLPQQLDNGWTLIDGQPAPPRPDSIELDGRSQNHPGFDPEM